MNSGVETLGQLGIKALALLSKALGQLGTEALDGVLKILAGDGLLRLGHSCLYCLVRATTLRKKIRYSEATADLE